MKKNVFHIIITTLLCLSLNAQVGVGTTNPQGVFNVDGAKDNPNSGSPTTTQQDNDFVVSASGAVGIGITQPTEKLDIIGNLKFSGVLFANGSAGTDKQVLVSKGATVAPEWTTMTTANSANIYTGNGTIIENRVATLDDKNISFNATTGNFIFNPSSTGKMGIKTTNPVGLLSNTSTNIFSSGALGQAPNQALAWSVSSGASAAWAGAFYNAATTNGGSLLVKSATITDSPIFEVATGSASDKDNSGVSGATRVFTVSGAGNANVANNLVVDTNSLFVNGATNNIGFGTLNPQGVFTIDGSKDNAASGTPTAAQQLNDFYMSAAGRVSIGIMPSSNKLHVNGSGKFTPTTTNEGTGEPVTIEMFGKSGTGTYTSVGGIKLAWYSAVGGIDILRGPSDKGMGMAFNIASETNVTSEAMRITATGNVGIGVTNPTNKLVVKGVNAQPTALGTENTTAIFRIDGDSNNSLDFGNLKDAPFGSYIQSHNKTTTNKLPLILNPVGGNVGIGTLNPEALLEVRSSLKEVARFVSNQGTTDFAHIALGNANGIWTKLSSGNGNFAIRNYNDDATILHAELATGNVGIGTSLPTTKLHVDSGTNGVSGLRLNRLSASSTSILTSDPIAMLGIDKDGVVVAAGSSKRTENMVINGTFTVPINTFGSYKITIAGSEAEPIPNSYKTFADEYLITYANNLTKLSIVHLGSVYCCSTTTLQPAQASVATALIAPSHGCYEVFFDSNDPTNVITFTAKKDLAIATIKSVSLF